MAKHKAGLHKEISSIFDGVPVPKNNGSQTSTGTSAVERPGHIPPVPKQQSPAPSYTPPPQPQQPTQPPKKAPKVKKPKIKVSAVRTTAIENQLLQLWETIKTKLLTLNPGVSPARQMTTVILIPILFVVMIFVFSRVLGSSSTKKAKATNPESNAVMVGTQSEINWEIPELYPTTLRNPMKTVTSTVANIQADGLVVRGIVYSKDSPSAVIGTQIVFEGETVSGVTIVKINKNSVEFEKDGKKWTQKVQD